MSPASKPFTGFIKGDLVRRAGKSSVLERKTEQTDNLVRGRCGKSKGLALKLHSNTKTHGAGQRETHRISGWEKNLTATDNQELEGHRLGQYLGVLGTKGT